MCPCCAVVRQSRARRRSSCVALLWSNLHNTHRCCINFSDRDKWTCSGHAFDNNVIPTSCINAHCKIASLNDPAIDVNLAVSASLRFGTTFGTASDLRCRERALLHHWHALLAIWTEDYNNTCHLSTWSGKVEHRSSRKT